MDGEFGVELGACDSRLISPELILTGINKYGPALALSILRCLFGELSIVLMGQPTSEPVKWIDLLEMGDNCCPALSRQRDDHRLSTKSVTGRQFRNKAVLTYAIMQRPEG